MAPEEAQSQPGHSFRSIHLSAEELAHLSPDELLQACLEYHQLLHILKGVLYTPDASLTMRIVAMDLVCMLAHHDASGQESGRRDEVVYVKQVSERLGLQPKAVRTAYGQLEQRGALDMTDIQFPGQR
jgi:hypothetical protein